MPMNTLIKRLQIIERRGFCWSIGRSRLAEYECRIFPLSQELCKPVIIEGGAGFAQAVDKALLRLGDQVPHV